MINTLICSNEMNEIVPGKELVVRPLLYNACVS